MTMLAILTKYHPPIGAKVGRISAWTKDAKMLFSPAENTKANHMKAAQSLMKVHEIADKYVQVQLPEGGAEYVVIVGDL
jgi:hypothetical protein